jgi:putative glutamine amidotransferase
LSGSDHIPGSFRSRPPSPRPVIGLTTYLQQAKSGIWDVHAAFLSDRYIHGVNSSGGIATLLPPQPVDDDIAGQILDGIDGLILTGGRDVDPAAYGHQAHPTTDEPDTQRDTWEFALVGAALRRRLPVLGICRGAQVLNVALGGTLHQHLPDVVGHTHHQQGNAVFATSSISTVAGSRLAGLLGESTSAQCYHHQGIDRLGDGLTISGLDEDGVIGAVEIPGEDFVLAVQWHPEETLDDLRLFTGLIEAARTYTQERPPGGTSEATRGRARV